MSLRIVVRIDDAAMAANVGGGVHTTYQTFEIDAPALEQRLRNKPSSFFYATVVGAELSEQEDD